MLLLLILSAIVIGNCVAEMAIVLRATFVTVLPIGSTGIV